MVSLIRRERNQKITPFGTNSPESLLTKFGFVPDPDTKIFRSRIRPSDREFRAAQRKYPGVGLSPFNRPANQNKFQKRLPVETLISQQIIDAAKPTLNLVEDLLEEKFEMDRLQPEPIISNQEILRGAQKQIVQQFAF